MDAVNRIALRLSQGRESDADDRVQETLVRAHRSWHTYERGTECRSWLFTIRRNQFLKSRRRKSHSREIPASQIKADVESLAATAVFSAVQSADPEREFFDSLVDEAVMAAIDRLPDPFREAVVLSDPEGMAYPQVSEVLGVLVGTVKSRIFRERRLLREALYEHDFRRTYLKFMRRCSTQQVPPELRRRVFESILEEEPRSGARAASDTITTTGNTSCERSPPGRHAGSASTRATGWSMLVPAWRAPEDHPEEIASALDGLVWELGSEEET